MASFLDSSAASFPPKNYSVQARAAVQENPASITLSWVADGDAANYRISRRDGSRWTLLAELSGTTTSWTDSNVAPGQVYEYQLIKNAAPGYRATGYVFAGIRVPFPDFRGKLILLVENSVAGALGTELNRLRQDLTGDGWVVIRRNVSAADSPQSVKSVIKSVYDSDPANVKALFLFGHIPVPYSGNIAPDGHDNHRGAWPADTFYGDMDGSWTDHLVNTRDAERQINWNVPGDGKFDPGVIPSAIELMIGRVDLHNMTCFANKSPSRSELDLLRQYLHKNNAYRWGQINPARRAIICDNFSDKGDDPIGGSAWRNFPPTVGAENILEVPWDGFFPTATQESFLWGFASGGGSYYYSMGVGTSDDFALKDLKIVFAMFMGSYFGDWNNESNFLRASLGSGTILTATYSGFPQTLYFPMGTGETIGHCIRLTQNNLTNTIYSPFDQGQGEVHVALMGDPTLRLYPVLPPSNLSVTPSIGSAQLTWSESPDSSLAGYHVYRATTPEGPFTRASQELVPSTSFTDSPGAGNFTYMVRAVKLEQSPSGTFFNPSQGIFATASITGEPATAPPAAPQLQASATSHSRVDLQWNDLPNETGYKLERKQGFGAWSEIAALGPNVTTFANEDLPASTEFFYRIRAFNDAGNSAYSGEVRAVTREAPQPQASVQFVEADSFTSGSWPRKFGAEGYLLPAITGALPVPANLSGKEDFVWDKSSSDPRAPFVSPTSSDRTAAGWYGDAIALDLNVPPESFRRVALYLLDWDRLDRRQRVSVSDSATGAVLDARELSSFGDGTYLVYEIKGAVRLTIEKVSGPNALLNGVFLGGAAASPISNKPLTLGLRLASPGEILLMVSGDSGQNFRVDSSPDCVTWSPLTSGTLTEGTTSLPIPLPNGAHRIFLRAVNTP